MAQEPDWLVWARRMQAIAQNGLTFARDPFDIERYTALRALAVEILAARSGADPALVASLFAGETGYATPKVDVRGVVFHKGLLLLVRERQDGGWTLPGGWADVGETPSEAVVKEVREESGYEVRAAKLLALLDRSRQGHPPQLHHIYKAFIRCELVGGQAVSESVETDGVGFFGEHEIPPLSLNRVLPHQIARLFEHYRHPEWPADFD